MLGHLVIAAHSSSWIFITGLIRHKQDLILTKPYVITFMNSCNFITYVGNFVVCTDR